VWATAYNERRCLYYESPRADCDAHGTRKKGGPGNAETSFPPSVNVVVRYLLTA